MIASLWRPRLIASIIAALLLVSELTARFGFGLGEPPVVERDPDIEYMLKPSKTYHRFGNEIAINAHRMRAAPMSAEKDAGEYRVMLVGDSVVYGNHRVDQAETIAARLRDRLSEGGRCPVVVGAIAASSWGPVNQRAFIERFGLFGADAMVLVASSHDLADTPTHAAPLIPYRLHPSYLAIFDAAEIVIERLARRVRPAPPPAPFENRVAQSRAALFEIFAMARRDGADRFFAYHPTATEILGEPDPLAFSAFRDIADQSEATFLDLRSAHGERWERAYEDVIHLSAAGAENTAMMIETALRARAESGAAPTTCLSDRP